MRKGSTIVVVIIGAALGGLLPSSAAAAAELRVDRPDDAVDADVGDGTCAAAGGGCTLRAAVQEAGRAGAAATIVVPAGRYVLSLPPVPQAGSIADVGVTSGDLDLAGDVTVAGEGAGKTVIDGGGVDRVFDVGSGVTARLRDLTITGGDATAGGSQEINLGGGILNKGAITLDRVELVGNVADGGGGMFSIPRTMPVVRDSLVVGNSAFEGGGLRIDSGGTIVNTTITGNRLRELDPATLADKPVGVVTLVVDEIAGYGGGIDHRGGADLTIINSTITGNAALKGGGGIGAGQAYTPISEELPLGKVLLTNTVVSGNTSAAGPQDCRTNQVKFVTGGGNVDLDGSCFLQAARGDRPKTDPQLGPLAEAGGPTRTHVPLAGSPAIDGGTAEGCPKADARGVARPQGAACDAGAVEVAPAAPAPASAPPAPAACRRTVRLPSRLRGRARSFDVLVGRRVVARGRRPGARVAVARHRKVVLRVRLRSGRVVRTTVRTTCRR